MCIVEYLTGDGCPEALSLTIGHYAKCMKFNILIAFNGHKKAHAGAVTLDNPCVLELKLFAKLTALFGFIPKSTSSRDMHTHGLQEHIFEKNAILDYCLACA